jgi:hypothetical protein
MRQLLLLFIGVIGLNIVIGQDPQILTLREAYDYSVGDTFQYLGNRYSITTIPIPSNIVILNKKVRPNQPVVEYVQRVERYYLVETRPNVFTPRYENVKEYWYYDRLGNSVTARHRCDNIPMPTPTFFCFDSITVDYNNRKTFKHEYNTNGIEIGKEHFAQGLGLTLSTRTNFQTGVNMLYKLSYFSKNGERWGEKWTEFEKEKPKFKHLTNREVFDFEVGDEFAYATVFYNFDKPSLDTNFLFRTVIRRFPDSADMRTYIYKDIYTVKDKKTKILERLDTVKIVALDSIAVYKIVERVDHSLETYVSDFYYTLSNSNRLVSGRDLNCNCFDFDDGDFFGKGIGLVYAYGGFPYENRLIYFKKGNEIWGKPIVLTSTSTPSVEKPKITLSPNPVQEVLAIQTTADFDAVKIMSIYGQEVSVIFKNETTIPLSHLPNGIYLLQLFDNNRLIGTEKFVVQH